MGESDAMIFECPMCLNKEEFTVYGCRPHVFETEISAGRVRSQRDIELPISNLGRSAVVRCKCGYEGPSELFGYVSATATITDFMGCPTRPIWSYSVGVFGLATLLFCMVFDRDTADAVRVLQRLYHAPLSDLPEFLAHEHPAVRIAAVHRCELLQKLCFPKIVISKEEFESGIKAFKD